MVEERLRQLDGPQAEGGELEPHVPSRGTRPSRMEYGGPDVEVAALLGRTDEVRPPCTNKGKGRATGPGEVMDVDRRRRPVHCGGANVITSVLLRYHEPCGTLLPRLG